MVDEEKSSPQTHDETGVKSVEKADVSTQLSRDHYISNSQLHTSTFSIAAAIENRRNYLQARRKIDLSSGNSTNHNESPHAAIIDVENIQNTGSCNVTEVIGVVLSTAIRPYSRDNGASSHLKSHKALNSRIHVLIGDNSLNHGQCARVTLNISPSGLTQSMASLLGILDMRDYACQSNTNILYTSPNKDGFISSQSKLGTLQPGDVVRWINLEVRSYCSDFDDNNTRSTNMKLHHRIMQGSDNYRETKTTTHAKDENPHSLNSHCSLFHVICDLIPSWKEPTSGPTLARLCRIIPTSPSNSNFYLEWERFIPCRMETSQDVVIQLAIWYCQYAKSNIVMDQRSTINQPDLLCQKRRLRDITAQNIMSHIVVKVLRCERASLSPKVNLTFGYISAAKASIDRTIESGVVHATLVDGLEIDDMIGFGCTINYDRADCSLGFIPKSISTILLQSMMEGSQILLTHVLSQIIPGGVASSLHERESLIIIPTKETTATIITSSHPYFVRDNCLPYETDHTMASQSTLYEKKIQMISMSQQHSPLMTETDFSQSLSHYRGVIVVVSPLIDIVVEGFSTSFLEGDYWKSAFSLSKFLINNPTIGNNLSDISLKPSYRSATIMLNSNVLPHNAVVNADADAVKLLCMDVPVEDMIVEDGQNSLESHPFLHHVGILLKALCEERTPIRWVLEQESECKWFVESAALIKI